MRSNEARICHCHCVPNLSEGIISINPPSIGSWAKLILKRSLSPPTKRNLKKFSNTMIQRFKFTKPIDETPVLNTASTTKPLKTGDKVRIRSEDEIKATLNAWNEYKGCMFMDAQRQYCGTIQRVFKSVERFVDERDYRVKKARGLILLVDLICEGTPDYGRCDRSCFYFWRTEWLEKLE